MTASIYKTGTVLKRNTAKHDGYDDVIIVGANPTRSPNVAEWAGENGPGFLVQPLSFGDTKVLYVSEASAEYKIIKEGSGLSVDLPGSVLPGGELAQSPEEAFATAAAKAEGQKSPTPPEEQVKIVEKVEEVKTNGEEKPQTEPKKPGTKTKA